MHAISQRSGAIVNARIFDGTSEQLIEGTIHVEDGTVVGIDESTPTTGQLLDAEGRTVVPGFIDAHFHAYGTSLNMLELEASPASYVAIEGSRRLEAALRRGFTTVRDVAGGDPGLARAIEEGLRPSPRYLYTGRALTQTGGHGDPRPGDSELCACSGHIAEIVDGVDDLRVAVRDRFRRGAHAIKIMASGGVVSPTDPIRVPQYSAEEIRVVSEEATRRGSYVAAHAYSPEAVVHAVTNGVRSIEHGNLLDEPTAALMAEHGAFLVPTLATYDAMDRRGAELGLPPVSQVKNREVLAAGQRAIEIAKAAGVRIAFGTDLMGALEDEQLAGIRLQVEVLGVADALRSITSGNADLLGRTDLGRVESGSQADFVILDGDPFAEPSILWDPTRTHAVIQGGAVVGDH